MPENAKEWIKQLDLTAHPEGGYFKEIYRNSNCISDVELNQKYSGKRNLSTSIYFLLESTQLSKLHRLKSDEIWYFQYGSPIKVHVFDNETYTTYIMGTAYEEGQLLQLIIPAGAVFGAEVMGEETFCIVGCMVSPGFHFDDFELITFNELIPAYPNNEKVIRRFTQGNN
jgi:uncharacterized protein